MRNAHSEQDETSTPDRLRVVLEHPLQRLFPHNLHVTCSTYQKQSVSLHLDDQAPNFRVRTSFEKMPNRLEQTEHSFPLMVEAI
jgi:hypothetical protein